MPLIDTVFGATLICKSDLPNQGINKTAEHLQAMVRSKTSGETRVDLQLSKQVHREMEHHNKKVKRNREILKRLIDCVIFLGKQEFSFQGHDESAGSKNRGNYVELLSLIAERNMDLHYQKLPEIRQGRLDFQP